MHSQLWVVLHWHTCDSHCEHAHGHVSCWICGNVGDCDGAATEDCVGVLVLSDRHWIGIVGDGRLGPVDHRRYHAHVWTNSDVRWAAREKLDPGYLLDVIQTTHWDIVGTL